MPLHLPCLSDVGRARTELQKAFELGVLIAVGGVDVDVQPGFPLLRLIPATEDDRRLRTAEPFARPDLHRAVVLAIEHDEVQDLTPEPRQHLRVAATEHELTDTTCHTKPALSLPAVKTIPRPYRTRRARANEFRATWCRSRGATRYGRQCRQRPGELY